MRRSGLARNRVAPSPVLLLTDPLPWAEKEAKTDMLLVALLILALALFAGGFVIHWLFVAAVIVALVWVISLFTGGIRSRGSAH